MRGDGRRSTHLPIRPMASVAILSLFLLYTFLSGVTALPFSFQLKPDFSRYHKISTLNTSSHNRILFVGDIHGRFHELQELLRKTNFNPAAGDVLVHTGDIITKGSLQGSKKVVQWMATNNIHGVRGNHDQAIIDWKSWRDWISSTSAGKAWLHSLEEDWKKERTESSSSLDPVDWAKDRRKNSPRKFKSWWRRVPQGWKMFNEHYLIAAYVLLKTLILNRTAHSPFRSSLEKHEYEYLLSLPLVLHIPSIHTFTVHAGILPSDVSLPATARTQPLAHIPSHPRHSSPDEETLRLWQELAILNDVPQNNEPWVTLNIRSILKDKTISR